MSSHEPQTITLSRHVILLITLVGVSCLTVCYVLGVHVGRQSAALHRSVVRGIGEDLQKLPATVQDQIRTLDDSQDTIEPQRIVSQSIAAGGTAKVMADNKVIPAKPAAVVLPKSGLRGGTTSEKKIEDTNLWTTQLISTPDLAEARRMLVKMQAAGFPALIVSEKGLFKVRLAKNGKKELVDAVMSKLRNKGLKPFIVRVD